MADYRIEISSKYDISTYQDVKVTYNWIVLCFKKLFKDDLELYTKIDFRLSKMNVGVYSIEEFTDVAFGNSDFELCHMYLSAKNLQGDLGVSVTIFDDNNLAIYTADKLLLDRFIDILNETDLEEKNIATLQNQTIINNNNINISGDISGDNNIVGNIGSEINKTERVEKSESKIKEWLKAIAQNIISNWLIYLLSIGAAGLLVLLEILNK